MSTITPNDPASPGAPVLVRARRIASRALAAALEFSRREAVRRLLLGLPALATASASLLGLSLLRTDPTEVQVRYEKAAARARTDNDPETARVCLDRLIALKQTRPVSAETVERLARLALDLGQAERGDVLLAEAAPNDRPGNAPAHLARALLLLRSPGPGRGISRADRVRAEKHLRHALMVDPDLSAAHEILGRIAAQDGDLAEAEKHLERAAQANPALGYQLALVMGRQGRPESVIFWARHARDHYARIVEREPDDRPARQGQASAEILMGEFAAARTTLGRGLARADLRAYHELVARSYVAEAADQLAKGNRDPGTRLKLLEGAMQHDPNDPALVEQLATVLDGSGPEADRLRAQLRDSLARGTAVTTAHLILGFDAWQHGRAGEAQLHWESALKANPTSAVVANNLAWSLATGPNPDLPRALRLIDSVAILEPRQPALLGTRGRILARLGRWRDALADLEVALATEPGDRELHADLAEVYAALKAPELSEQHRRLAETLPAGTPR